jgi:hypothetical protein
MAKKVPPPPMLSMKQIDALSPEKAAKYWDQINTYGSAHPAHARAWLAKLGTLRQNHIQQRISADTTTKPTTYDVPFIAREGMPLGAARLDTKTGQPVPGTSGLTPNTQMFKGRAPGQDPTAVALADAMGYGAANPQTHAPRYLYGAQFQAINLPVDDRIALQEKLEKAGLLEPGSYIRGVWGGESAAAYSQAMADANVADQDVDMIIQQRIDNPQLKKDARGPLVTTLTNPADIMAAAKTAAQNLYGRNVELPKGVQDMLVSGLQETERQLLTQEYNLGGVNGPGGVATATPSPTAYAEQQLKQMYPGRETDDEFSNAMNTILNMMGGSG